MSEDEQEIYATLVEIKQEPTELYKILKFADIVSGGGEAKQVISEGYVYLNGEVETRKRKKIYAGDLLYFNGQYFQIALQGAAADYEIVEPHSEQQGEETKSQKNNKKARKPISF
jgi:ribosome-associated protein